MKGNTKATTPQAYIDSLEGERKEQIIALDKLIKETVPDLTPHIQSGMLGYGVYHYRYKSGREGDRMVVGLASQKNYISIYVCMTDGDEYLAEKYAKELGKVNVGKSCIRCKKMEDLDLEVLKKVLKLAQKQAKAIDFTYIQ